MPPEQSRPSKSLEQIAEEVGLYPPEAYEFVQAGLQYTVQKLHASAKEGESRHVNGRELSEGLREFALSQWGLMARAVLNRWGITRTDDFGRIVFALVDNGWLSKTEEDSLSDFRSVYDFATAFEEGYRIGCKA